MSGLALARYQPTVPARRSLAGASPGRRPPVAEVTSLALDTGARLVVLSAATTETARLARQAMDEITLAAPGLCVLAGRPGNTLTQLRELARAVGADSSRLTGLMPWRGFACPGMPSVSRPLTRFVEHQDRRVAEQGVEAINIGSSDALGPAASATAVAGKGIVGDRHFADHGARPGNALTLIEAEVLEDVGVTGPQSRRQVVVRGVRVNDLIGKRFRVGDVECVGVEICESCLHLQRLTGPGIIKDLIHRGGLNADILSDGTISVGDRLLPDFRPTGHTELLSRWRGV